MNSAETTDEGAHYEVRLRSAATHATQTLRRHSSCIYSDTLYADRTRWVAISSNRLPLNYWERPGYNLGSLRISVLPQRGFPPLVSARAARLSEMVLGETCDWFEKPAGIYPILECRAAADGIPLRIIYKPAIRNDLQFAAIGIDRGPLLATSLAPPPSAFRLGQCSGASILWRLSEGRHAKC